MTECRPAIGGKCPTAAYEASVEVMQKHCSSFSLMAPEGVAVSPPGGCRKNFRSIKGIVHSKKITLWRFEFMAVLFLSHTYFLMASSGSLWIDKEPALFPMETPIIGLGIKNK